MENSAEYSEDDDLGLAIDERLQMSRTAGKIAADKMKINTLIELLIEHGVIRASEYGEKLAGNERKLLDSLNEAIANYPQELQSVNDAKRFIESFQSELSALSKKIAAREQNRD